MLHLKYDQLLLVKITNDFLMATSHSKVYYRVTTCIWFWTRVDPRHAQGSGHEVWGLAKIPLRRLKTGEEKDIWTTYMLACWSHNKAPGNRRTDYL